MKKQNYGILSGVLFGMFVLFTIIVSRYDVKNIGAQNTSVGLASINNECHKIFGYNKVWYDITSVLGIVAIIIAISFGIVGIIQMFKRRSLLRVDSDILLLGGFYVLVMACYALFEVFIVNYRPIIIESKIEASYPSSHTVLVISVMLTAILQYKYRIKNILLSKFARIISMLIIVIMIVGRLLSGVHWLSDIVAGVILGCALAMLYYALFTRIHNDE